MKSCTLIKQSAESLQQGITKQPVAVAFHVSLTFQFYFGGIYNPWFCYGEPNHGVLAVGYDLTNSTPFWKIKNSWGAGWGEKGYFRMAIGKQ